jgi:hypothetical protein
MPPRALFDATVRFDPNLLRPATSKVYWWVLGRWALALAAVLWALGVLTLVFHLGSELYWVLMIVGLVVAAEAFLFPFWQGGARSNLLNRGDFHFFANEEGLRIDGPFGTQTVRWNVYRGTFRDDRFLYLMVTRRNVQIVPLFGASDPKPLIDHLDSIGLRPRRFNMLRP